MNILRGVNKLLEMGGRPLVKQASDFANGTVHFFKLLRAGKLKDIERLCDAGKIFGEFQVTKFESDLACALGEPYLVGDPFHNQLVNAGLVIMWELFTAQNGRTAFSNANGFLGVGDSSAAVTTAQTDLQAASNKVRTAMDATFPNAPANGVEQWRATLTSGNGNFHWQEYALFNASSGITMFNRSLSDQGTKTTGQSWQLLYQITMS